VANPEKRSALPGIRSTIRADVILRRDAQGGLTFVDRAFCCVFGVEREDVLVPSCIGRWPANRRCRLAPQGQVRRQRYLLLQVLTS
jgi:hypothetical protein